MCDTGVSESRRGSNEITYKDPGCRPAACKPLGCAGRFKRETTGNKNVDSKAKPSGHSTPSKNRAEKGAEDAFILTEQDKRGYALGVELGLDIVKHGADINHHLVMQGMRDAIAGKKFLMTAEDMNVVLLEMQKEQRDRIALAHKADSH